MEENKGKALYQHKLGHVCRMSVIFLSTQETKKIPEMTLTVNKICEEAGEHSREDTVKKRSVLFKLSSEVAYIPKLQCW